MLGRKPFQKTGILLRNYARPLLREWPLQRSRIDQRRVRARPRDDRGRATLCRGSNGAGQLGDGTTDWSTVPVAVSGLVSGSTASVTTGNTNTTLAISSTGAALGWGTNDGGILDRDATTTDSLVPVEINLTLP